MRAGLSYRRFAFHVGSSPRGPIPPKLFSSIDAVTIVVSDPERGDNEAAFGERTILERIGEARIVRVVLRVSSPLLARIVLLVLGGLDRDEGAQPTLLKLASSGPSIALSRPILTSAAVMNAFAQLDQPTYWPVLRTVGVAHDIETPGVFSLGLLAIDAPVLRYASRPETVALDGASVGRFEIAPGQQLERDVDGL